MSHARHSEAVSRTQSRRKIFEGIFQPWRTRALMAARQAKIQRHQDSYDPYHLPAYRHPLARVQARKERHERTG